MNEASDYRYTQPWQTRGDGVGGYISVPGRCPARRNATLADRFWAWWWECELDDLIRCEHYEGHEQYGHDNPNQADHKSGDDRWPAQRNLNALSNPSR